MIYAMVGFSGFCCFVRAANASGGTDWGCSYDFMHDWIRLVKFMRGGKTTS